MASMQKAAMADAPPAPKKRVILSFNSAAKARPLKLAPMARAAVRLSVLPRSRYLLPGSVAFR